MADADISRKRRTELAIGANERRRLIFGATITLKVTNTSRPTTTNFIVHRSLILQRATKFDQLNDISIVAKTDAVSAYLHWAYSQSFEPSKMADCVDNWFVFEWNVTSGRSIEEQDTIYRILGLFDLWYVGHVLGDWEFCDLVMDTICQQDLGNHLIPDLAEWVWKCRCAERCWEGGSDGFFEGPFLWLLDRLSMPGCPVALLDVMRNEQMTHFAQSLLERMSHGQQLGLENHPLVATIVPEHYHVN